jgi:DNA repair photolyase
MPVRVRETGCRSILSPSRIPGIDYSVNPYIGCLHGCVYCYAKFLGFNKERADEWGNFCDVKINAPIRFRREIVRARPGNISISTATDAYQAIEKKYGLTRQILESLIHLPFSVSILTKSDLVLRDVDILQKFPRDRCSVGFSLTASDDRLSRCFEPGAPPVSKRVEALKILHEYGLRTWAFLAPVLPVFTVDDYVPLLLAIRGTVDHVLIDPLNPRYGISAPFMSLLKSVHSGLNDVQIRVLTDPAARKKHNTELLAGIGRLCQKLGIHLNPC